MSDALLRERYRCVRPDGGDGALLAIERRPTDPQPTRHPMTGEPLRRLWDCAPPEHAHVVAS